MSDDYLERSNFLNRIASLQRLCSDHDGNYPKALLFVAGQDGRYNKGSVTVLKYLLRGSVGKELFDETLDPQYEAMEDIILLVQQSSVSVVWTHQMKELLSPLFETIPFLVEYLSTVVEEAEIDLLQARKCCDFKRMMLAAVEEGGGVGVPVPIGYDDIQDVENWPILRSFALEEVYCPTGFFTARYTVADITAHLDVLLRAVDGYYLDSALRSLGRTVGPHAMQAVSMLDASTAEQRARLSAEDVAGPLEILFEFGEMEAVGSVDPSTRPIVLFGADTSLVGSASASAAAATRAAAGGAGAGPCPTGWESKLVGAALHCVMEGCDPSSGIRWCRTYFLQRGRTAATVRAPDGLVEDQDDDDDNNDDDNGNDSEGDDDGQRAGGRAGSAAGAESKVSGVRGHGSSGHRHGGQDLAVSRTLTASLLRLEELYIKLWLLLRLVVKDAYSRHVDVLDAGKDIQSQLDQLMKTGNNNSTRSEGEGKSGDNSPSSSPASRLQLPEEFQALVGGVVLRAPERLQVHMDCVNALGEIVAIEDVDDMGGSCWTYIRVAVHGIQVPYYHQQYHQQHHQQHRQQQQSVSVAVGDTFLFSAHAPTISSPASLGPAGAGGSKDGGGAAVVNLSPLLSDSCCVTHALPYYRCFMGAGAEEHSAQRLLSSTKSIHMLSTLGLGRALDHSGTGLMTVPVLSDHPVLPVFDAELRAFSEGFVVEKIDNSQCLPILVALGAHCDRVWTVDAADCMAQASKLLPAVFLSEPHLPDIDVPSGLLIVFRLKPGSANAETGADGNGEEGVDQDILNPLARSFPLVGAPDTAELSNSTTGGSPSSSSSSTTAAGPRVAGAKHLALFVRSGSRAAPALMEALTHWRRGLRLHEIQEHRGGSDVALPDPLLRAFLVALDHWSAGVTPSTIAAGELSAAAADRPAAQQAVSHAMLVTTARCFSMYPHLKIPGAGLFSMRCVHSMSESLRLSLLDFQDEATIAAAAAVDAARSRSSRVGGGSGGGGTQLVLLCGLPGTGVAEVAQLWAAQLVEALGAAGVRIKCAQADFVLLQHDRQRRQQAQQAARRESKSGEGAGSGNSGGEGEVVGVPVQPLSAAEVVEFVQSVLRDAVICDAAPNSRPAETAEQVQERRELVLLSVVMNSALHVPLQELTTLAGLAVGATAAPPLLFSVVVPSMMNFGPAESAPTTSAPAPAHATTSATKMLKGSSSNNRGSRIASGKKTVAKQVTTTLDSYSSLPLSASHYGLGQEYALALHRELICAGCCDVAVVVDEHSDASAAAAYDGFRALLSAANPAALIVRLAPTNLRLDGDRLDTVLKLIQQQYFAVASNSGKPAGNMGSGSFAEKVSCAVSRATPSAALVGALLSAPAPVPAPDSQSLYAHCLHSAAVPGCVGMGADQLRGFGAVAGTPSVLVLRPSDVGATEWNVQHVLQILQQVLFPASRLSSARVDEDSWKVPPHSRAGAALSTGSPSHFQRLIELAKAKVLSSRQREAGNALFASNLRVLAEEQGRELALLARDMQSVHGFLTLPAGVRTNTATTVGAVTTTGTGAGAKQISTGGGVASIEANKSFMVVRGSYGAEASKKRLSELYDYQSIPSAAAGAAGAAGGAGGGGSSSSRYGATLIFQGCFTARQAALLRQLLHLCAQYRLRPKPHLTLRDVSKAEKLSVQANPNYCNLRELPAGWWFDGVSYVDIDGTRRDLRPDIELLLEAYVQDTNARVDEYNHMLSCL